MVAADQGSDINLIYPHLRKELGLKMRSVAQLNLPPIKITVALGQQLSITHWVQFECDVAGVQRTVWALVCPTDR